MSYFSDTLIRVKPSSTLAAAERARQMQLSGRNVISLSTGEPDFDTPSNIKKAGIAAIERGKTKYTAVSGIAELKAAIVGKLERENAVTYNASEIVVSNGAKQVIANAFLSTLNPGDEVIVPAPFWVSYPDLASMCGAVPVSPITDADSGFKLTPPALKVAITSKTKWLVINSPSNPSGAVYSASELRGLAEVLREFPEILIMCDDIYEHLVYADEPFVTLAAVVPDLRDRILTVNGVSKGYAMTGWRIGYGAGPTPLIQAMDVIQGQFTTNPCAISQWAAVEALNGPQDFIRERLEVFRSRRDLVVKRLNSIAGLKCLRPDGAFYAFASCAGAIGKTTKGGVVIRTDEEFVRELLDQVAVSTVHGSAFGSPGYFRVSYAASTETLGEACDRIEDFCNSLI